VICRKKKVVKGSQRRAKEDAEVANRNSFAYLSKEQDKDTSKIHSYEKMDVVVDGPFYILYAWRLPTEGSRESC